MTSPLESFNFRLFRILFLKFDLVMWFCNRHDKLPSAVPVFHGPHFRELYWNSIPDDKLYHIMDGWQAGYSDLDIKSMVQIKDVPSQAYIDARLLKCLNSSHHGHLVSDCPCIFCQRCIQPIDQ